MAEDEQTPQTAQEFADRANRRLAGEDFDGAIADLDEIIRLQPDSAEAWHDRGSIKFTKGDVYGALSDYDEAIRLQPKLADAWFNRGRAKGQKGDLDGAITDFDEAIRLQPNHDDAARYRKIMDERKSLPEGALLWRGKPIYWRGKPLVWRPDAHVTDESDQPLMPVSNNSMIVSAWNNGDTVYGISIAVADRNRYFSHEWGNIQISIAGRPEITCELTPGFWRNCPEIRNHAFRDWFEDLGHVKNGQKNWESGKPPKFLLTLVGNNRCKLGFVNFVEQLRAIRQATPLAERVEWVPETRKIRVVPVPMGNTALWHVILDKLRDAAVELRSNPSLANSHAALASEAERLVKIAERHKDSPQRVHDEIATTLEVMERLAKMREIPDDAETVRFRRMLKDCTLDIQGDVAEVRIVVEKRTALKIARASKEEREQLSSVTAEVILHIEDGRAQEDMREDAKMLAEQPEEDDSLQRKAAIYRLLSRLSRMLEMLKENGFVTAVAAGLTVSGIKSAAKTISQLLGLG